MSYFKHHPHVYVDINEWVAAEAFACLDEVEQAKFFQHLAVATAKWKTNRVFQWQSMCDEIWKEFSDTSPYEDAKKMLAEWVEYFGAQVHDPGGFWQGEAQRMEEQLTAKAAAIKSLSEANERLRARIHTQDDRLRSFDAQIEDMHSRSADLVDQRDAIAVKNSRLNERNGKLVGKIARLEARVKTLEQQIDGSEV